MTFLKFIIWKIKNMSSTYWMLLVLKIFVRIFGMITLLYTMNLLVKVNTNNPEHLHNAISSVFYLAFFVFFRYKHKSFFRIFTFRKNCQTTQYSKMAPIAYCWLFNLPKNRN